jgi:transposase
VAEGCQRAARLLADVPGLERRSIEVIIPETDADMSRFPGPGHLALWAGLCPGNHESAGKRRRVATTPGNQWLRRTLIESAPGRGTDQGQLRRRPVPADIPPPGPEQGRRRGRAQPPRRDLAHPHHR